MRNDPEGLVFHIAVTGESRETGEIRTVIYRQAMIKPDLGTKALGSAIRDFADDFPLFDYVTHAMY